MTAGLTVGNILGNLPNAVELRAGLEVSSACSLPYDAARDPLFTTEYQFKAKSAIGPGPGLQKLLDWASVVATADISFSLDTSLGGSPSASAARLSQNSFKTGENVSFNVALDPTTTKAPLGLNTYNVQEVRIYRLDDTNQTATQIASAVAADGQTDFAIPWQAAADGAVTVNGKPAYYAFVVPKFFDILRTEFPIELGQVQGPSITIAPDQTAITQGNTVAFDALIDGTKATSGVAWSATGGSVTAGGAFTAGSVAGQYEVRAIRVSTGEVAVAQVLVQAVVLPPSVTAVAVSPIVPKVGDNATFSVTGSNLVAGLVLNFPGCTPVEIPRTSNTLRQFSCLLSMAGTNLPGSVSVSGMVTPFFSFTQTVSLSGGVAANEDSISAGQFFTCAVTAAGAVKCWGDNSQGNLINPISNGSSTPVDVTGLSSGYVAVSSPSNHACALSGAGGVKCWGPGPLGDGSSNTSRTPVDVVGLSAGVSQISIGAWLRCGLTAAGGVMCWGLGPVGDGTTQDRATPVDVIGLGGTVTVISTHDSLACAITGSGGLKCWGGGLAGDGTRFIRSTPVDVTGQTAGVMAVSAGGIHTCAVTSTGGAKCWGDNNFGNIGDGTLVSRLTPVDVVGLTSGVVAVSAGGGHTCALLSSGGVKCWGANSNGQLGDGSKTNRSVPTDVVGLTGGVAAISAGFDHTCARMVDGNLKCWGHNNYGQLGDGTILDRLTPVLVVGL